jgi:hypothetical protein
MTRSIVALLLLALTSTGLAPLTQATGAGQATNIAIGTSVLQPSVKRLGINLGDSDFYDAGQIMKNLVFRNPGFEGEIYQSTIRCASGRATACTDDNGASAWPTGYWNGATFEVFHGAARGRTGKVAGYTAAAKATGGTFLFSTSGVAPVTGDYMIVRMRVPGDAPAGWWSATSGKGVIATNASDLPPGTTGHQTVALNAPTASDCAQLAAHIDVGTQRSFTRLDGTFRLSFKAKGTGGSNTVAVNLKRNSLRTYLDQTLHLTNAWKTYTLRFTADERGSSLGTIELRFNTVGRDSFLMDDVSLTQTNSDPANVTAFRDPVVSALKTLQPGVLRFWAGQLGDTLDNLIADPFGRQRAGYLASSVGQYDISYGLPEFLQLCAAIGAEPWFVVPSTFSTTEAANLIEYLAGSSSSPYGAKRAAQGNPDPWTRSFARIHLEFGNEAWNSTFRGGTIEYAAPYGNRAQDIFAAMRADDSYSAAAFDLVLGGQAAWPGRNRDIQNHCNNNDSFAIAPYMMNTVNSFSDNEDLFGSAFAEPEAFVSPTGTAEGLTGGMMTLNRQAIQNSSHPVPLALYEMNLNAPRGRITQSGTDSFASSLGAGLAVVDAMLQQMGQGVVTQNLWNLSQYKFVRPDGITAYLWGAVVDMGVTNQRRPQYLAMQLANQAIGTNAAMLQTVQSGANPTWDQPLVNSVRLAGAHYLQSFAFSSGSNKSLIVFNLHRTRSLPVTFSGANAPSGAVVMEELTSVSPSDNNESLEAVRITGPVPVAVGPSHPISLPPYSMTSFVWRSAQ